MTGNTAAMVHGARSERLQRRIEDQAAGALAERRQAITEDLGGVGVLSTVAADTVDRYVTAAALLTWMERRLLAEGVLTGKGKRRAIHNAYLAQLDRVVRLAQQLGLDRKPQSVTVEEYVRRKAMEGHETAGTDPVGGAREGGPPRFPNAPTQDSPSTRQTAGESR